jgi:DNA-binding CsgD family transcriptional regulator
MPEKRSEIIDSARAAYRAGEWADATLLFLRADSFKELSPSDLELLVWAAAISAHDKEMLAALERLYDNFSAQGDHEQCARTAFWSGLRNMIIGEVGLGSAWLQRASKHAQQTADNCVQRGYLLLPQVFMHRAKGDYESAVDIAGRALEFGEMCNEPDLIALAGSLKGGILFRLGRIDEGYVPIDETMLLATAGRLSPVVTGVVYCEIVASCCRVLEMVRAREWTDILNDWCKRYPQARAFGGVCQVHRAEVLQLEGNWTEAYAEAERAGKGLVGTTEYTARANAAYRRGEILRCRGVWSDADAEYRRAAEIGFDPQPGLALLRLAQGRSDEAVAMIGRALRTASDMPAKAALLPAAIQIAIECDDLDHAEVLCSELLEIAEAYGTEVLARVADQGHGAVDLARGKFGGAVAALERARRYWSEFGAPYLVGRLRTDIGRAYLELGDPESAELELSAAEAFFDELGAKPDLALVRSLRPSRQADQPGSLTAREREVLSRMAEGETNKQMAVALGLSPKTVNRHVENIFDKLGVNTRAAAVASALKAGKI